MCTVHKMIRDVIGPGKRTDGDAYLPHLMSTELDYPTLEKNIRNTFETWELTVLLKSEVGLDDIHYLWGIVRNRHTNEITGALRIQVGTNKVETIDFHVPVKREDVFMYMKKEHHFHTRLQQLHKP